MLFLSVALAALSANNPTTSPEMQQLAQIDQLLVGLENVDLAKYWGDKASNILSNWNPGLGNDLDNIASDPGNIPGGVAQFHNDAMGFVNSFIPSKSLGLVDYWERPFVPDQAFAVQWVSYYEPWGWFWPGPAWYGPLPLQPQPAPPLGGSPGQMVQDPTTILPYLMSGIKYYLTIQLFLSSVDPSQPFNKFLANYSDDLRDYADFSLSLYKKRR